MKKKLSILVLVSTMLLNSVGVFAADFHDINDVPWEGAKEYINKVADLGLMVGSQNPQGNTIFNPKSNITYCETTQLVFNMIKTTQSVSDTSEYESKWSSVMASNNIPEWAYPAVSYCLEKGFLNISDIIGFMGNNGANNYATREDVAKLFASTLEDYDAQGSSLKFNDESQISSDALQSVIKLSACGIVSGDTDGNFNPKANINRSEMAVMVSKTYEYIKNYSGEKTETGVVTTVEDYGTAVYIAVNIAGSSKGFYIYSSASVTLNGSKVSASDIGIYDSVEITYEGADVISVDITDDFEVAQTTTTTTTTTTSTSDTISGDIESLSSTRIKLYSEYYYFVDEDDLEVLVDGKTKTLDYLLDIYDEEDYDYITAKITLNSYEEVTAIAATVYTDDDEDEDDGIIKSLTSSKIKIDSTSYYLADDVDVDVEDGDIDIDDIDDLIEAVDDGKLFEVTVYIEDDEVVEIVGEIVGIDECELYSVSSSSIKIVVDSGRYTYDVEDDCDIEIDGDSGCYLDDLEDALDDGDVYLELVIEDGEIVEIIAYID